MAPKARPAAAAPAAGPFSELVELAAVGGGGGISFVATGVARSVINALRRALIADVPTAAFCFDAYDPGKNGVLIRANTTCLYNEILGHRLSLIPIGFSENQLRLFEPSHYRFELRVKNESSEPRNVTTADFTVSDHTGTRLPQAALDALFPANPVTGDRVLIMRLRPAAYSSDGGFVGEELHVECTATLGTGAQHARWSPVSDCFFRNKHDPVASAAALEAQMEELRAGGAPDEVVERVRLDWPALDAHRHFLKGPDGEPSAFEFFVRSEMPGLRPTYLVFKAMRVLQQRLLDVARAVRGGEGADRIDVQPVPNMDDFFAVTVRGEDHTLGHLAQDMLFRHWIRDGAKADVSYIGYYKPHPLEQHIVIKIQCTRPGDDVRERLAGGLDWVRAQLADVTAEWVVFAGLVASDIVEVKEAMRQTAADRVRAPPPTAAYSTG